MLCLSRTAIFAFLGLGYVSLLIGVAAGILPPWSPTGLLPLRLVWSVVAAIAAASTLCSGSEACARKPCLGLRECLSNARRSPHCLPPR